MRFTLPVLAALAIHPLDLAAQDQKPQAPGGFEWRQFGATKALLLVPDGWFVMEQTEKGTHAIFITKESIEDKGKYSTGMSVTVVPKLKQGNAIQVARSHTTKLTEQNEAER